MREVFGMKLERLEKISLVEMRLSLWFMCILWLILVFFIIKILLDIRYLIWLVVF